MPLRAYKVLFVEDDPTHFLLTRELISLSKISRYDLEWVSDYDAALHQFQLCTHDAYLVDHNLGQRTGLELLKEAIQNGCRAPIIMLTGYGNDDLDVRAMEAGAADFLLKGQITADVLERSIRYSVERHRAFEALKSTQEYARCIVDCSIDMIVAVDASRRITQFNHAAEQSFEWESTEIIGKSVDVLYADPSEGRRVADQLLQSGRYVGEVKNVRKSGQPFYSLLAASVLHDASGKQIGFMGVSRDITERKQMEQEILKLNETLECRVVERTMDLERANAALEEEVRRRKKVQEEHERVIAELNRALGKVKTLSGLLPICSNCKKIRDDKGYWNQLEIYLRAHSGAEFTHGICPDCASELYGS